MADQERAIDRDKTVSAGSAEVVAPNDSTDLTRTTRGLYVGGAGDVRVLLDRDSAAVTFVGVQAGSVLPIRARRVYTASTATNMLALY